MSLRAFESSPKNWAESFYHFDTARFAEAWRTAGELFWVKAGERRALSLFHRAAARVPAYRDFLKKHRVKPAMVRTAKDFLNVPITTKENYIAAYPLRARMWDGTADVARLVAVSSGTSGEPQFWPRGDYQEFEAAVVHELLYRTFYDIDRYRTLLLVAFPVGIYVSGLATLMPSASVASKGYPFTVVGVSNQKADLLRALKNLAPMYEQVVIAGHPFFIKDALETARAEGIALPKRLHTFMCSEGFSEAWRTRVAAGAHANILNTYGSSELLLMAYETPLTIQIRNHAAFHDRFTKRLAMPSLFQYNPFLRWIESVTGELIFTSESGTPLVRFNIHDSGEVVGYDAMREAVPFAKRAANWQLPFVTLHGRSDRTLIFYAANIYPEHVKAGLDHPSFLKHLTGKFVMRKEYMSTMDECLEIHIELRAGMKANKAMARKVQANVVRTLHKLNMEYRDASARMHKDLAPRVKLWPYNHKKYFPPGVKPKYIIP